MSDPYGTFSDPQDFATQGRIATPSDTIDLETVAKTVSVTDVSAGAVLQILPQNNADGDWITYDPVPVGFSPPFRVRRIGAATTCTVATCEF